MVLQWEFSCWLLLIVDVHSELWESEIGAETK